MGTDRSTITTSGPDGTAVEPARWIRVVTLLGAAAFLLFGLWAFLAPQSFFDQIATFEPYNPHLIHDLGAFQVGIGAVLLLAAYPERIDGLAAALLGAGVGAAVHVIGHVIDIDLGGKPASDIPTLSILALAAIVAGYARLRETTLRR
ncbi:MAG: hypothetical protein KY469_10050 [Actinobacteria bacterium]|nr:hypothetical protein [Actinomycetota bacterium]